MRLKLLLLTTLVIIIIVSVLGFFLSDYRNLKKDIGEADALVVAGEYDQAINKLLDAKESLSLHVLNNYLGGLEAQKYYVNEDSIDKDLRVIRRLSKSSKEFKKGQGFYNEKKFHEAIKYLNFVVKDDVSYKEAQNLVRKSYQSLRLDSETEKYFFEISLGAEFGETENRIYKWVSNPKVKVSGQYNKSDLSCLDTVIKDLNKLINTITLKRISSGENLEVIFTPERNFANYSSLYEPINRGFFEITPAQDYSILKAKVLIDTENIGQVVKCHLIREELTQSLGLANDSNLYSDSIFYQPWTFTNSFSERDEKVITFLYYPEIKAGYSKKDIKQLFK